MQRREESDIYYTREKLTRMLERLKEMPNGEKGVEFLTHLQASGLSSVKVLRHAQCLRILENMDIQTAGRKEVESFVG
ncbi:MAG: hypothetical protein JRM80_01750 [Nitrososphaerota archaeon]|nr:hypothetical protein [Nitrososphaerota archaeon]